MTKWVHLNFGDSGLLRLLTKMADELKPGGVLLLQAHAWPSYKKEKRFCELFKFNYLGIKIRPKALAQVLREMGLVQEGEEGGVGVFRKGD